MGHAIFGFVFGLVGLLTVSDIVRAHAQAAMEVDDADRTVLPHATTKSLS